MKKFEVSRRHRLVPIAGTILSLFVFLITFYLDPLNFGQSQSLATLPAFLFSVLVLIMSQQLAMFSEVDKMDRRSLEVLEAVVGQVVVAQVGSPEIAKSYVVGRIGLLEQVRNTSFTLESERHRADEQLYARDVYEDLSTAIARFAEKPNTWRDVGDTRAARRFRDIAARSGPVETAEDGTPLFGYQYRMLDADPQMNFMLLTYRESQSVEVLFNWDFRRSGHSDPMVFSSRDPRIVEMFEAHFDLLWERAVIDHDDTGHDAKATKSSSTK